jgi:hypothetical protein
MAHTTAAHTLDNGKINQKTLWTKGNYRDRSPDQPKAQRIPITIQGWFRILIETCELNDVSDRWTVLCYGDSRQWSPQPAAP